MPHPFYDRCVGVLRVYGCCFGVSAVRWLLSIPSNVLAVSFPPDSFVHTFPLSCQLYYSLPLFTLR